MRDMNIEEQAELIESMESSSRARQASASDASRIRVRVDGVTNWTLIIRRPDQVERLQQLLRDFKAEVESEE